ncbi:MAG: polyprenyl synthetase family protein [Oscillospiraceae bacterium]|nr:polyprenyl synthetase family protein [Oscillospiraceae bacterium]
MNLSTTATRIDDALRRALAHKDEDYQRLWNAMNYSALAPGKRIRPFLTLAVSDMLGGNEEASMPLALAVECLHVSSLIHDDLPCMDNDTMRRGQPTCHVQFDEETALLAGDALMIFAFEIAASAKLPSGSLVESLRSLSVYAGVRGMMGGQMIDLQSERLQTELPLKTLYKLQSLKTGCLLKLAVRLGCLAAQKSPVSDAELYIALESYAEALGLLFQITDDILDVTATSKELGKSAGKDVRDGKATFVSALGLDGAKAAASRQLAIAKQSITCYDSANVLTSLAEGILDRRK